MPQALRRSLSVATATAVAASALVALGGAGVANAAAYPTINEFLNDLPDVSGEAEYVELHADANTDLSGHTLLVVRGGTANSPGLNGSVYVSRPVTGTTDADGFLRLDLTANTILNSTMTLMLVTGDAPARNADVDSNDDGVLDENLPFTIVDSVGTTTPNGVGFAYGDTILSPTFDGGSTFVGGASRIEDGVDTGQASDWARNAPSGFGLPGYDTAPIAAGQAVNTPGAPNAISEGSGEQPPVEPEPQLCTSPATLISAVQGDGDASPMVNQQVSVQGVVTAVHPRLNPSTGLATFAVQEEVADQDANPATSEGISVEAPTAAVSTMAVGQQVRVTGTVSEQYGRTHIDMASSVLCAASVAVPPATELTIPFAQSLEATEGMLVTFPQDLAILETYDFARYGELALGAELQYQPTSLYAPDSAEARALSDANWANRILLDDAVTAQNADPARHPNGQPFTLDNRFRAGDTVAGVTGVLDFGFSAWRIQPTAGATHTVVNERPDAPEVGGDIQIAAFNVLNYFTTLGERGAQNALELQRQQAKIVAAILEMDADIVGLMEIENGGPALSTLVDALNAAAGEPRYAAIETGRIGTDAIATALIYQPTAVSPEGAFTVLDETIDRRFDTSFNRPALTQSFAVAGSDDVLTVSVNHLKSKGDSSGQCLPVGTGLQGSCNEIRTPAAQALGEWLATDPTESGSTHSIILGDLNSYANEDPIVALEAAGFTNLLGEFQGEQAYTYTFDGMLGNLDYAMASESLTAQVVETAAWHSNTDEPSIIDYQTRFQTPAQAAALFAPDPYRASDHDAVLVGLAFEGAEPEPEPEVEVTTYAGADRYAANVAVSQDQFEAGSPVYLASGQVFADALTAGPAAAHDGASLLLTAPGALPAVTLAELDRLQPPAITIVGGPVSVSDAVLASLEERFPDADVTRIGGATRYDVAATVATEVFGSAETAFVASGEVFADALSASGVAATLGDVPVLLSTRAGLPEASADALEQLGVTSAYVIGGRTTLVDAVVRDVRAVTGWAFRISGSDRYAVNASLVERFVDPGVEQTVVVASGAVFADALSATAASGVTGGPLLLTPGQCTTLDVRDVIDAHDPAVVLNVGGPATISPEAWRTAC